LSSALAVGGDAWRGRLPGQAPIRAGPGSAAGRARSADRDGGKGPGPGGSSGGRPVPGRRRPAA